MEEQRASLKGRVRLLLATACAAGHNILIYVFVRVSIFKCISIDICVVFLVITLISSHPLWRSRQSDTGVCVCVCQYLYL